MHDMPELGRTCGHKQCKLIRLPATEIAIATDVIAMANGATDSDSNSDNVACIGTGGDGKKPNETREMVAKRVLLGGWLWCEGKGGVCEHGGWFHRLCCMSAVIENPCWWCEDCRPTRYHRRRIWKELEGAIAAAKAAKGGNAENAKGRKVILHIIGLSPACCGTRYFYSPSHTHHSLYRHSIGRSAHNHTSYSIPRRKKGTADRIQLPSKSQSPLLRILISLNAPLSTSAIA
ncbi:uncharacterized protein EV422DRAFT_387167 [Fimicolochytrium jonesii]|uniref:uncharacterized protein n=1 Tax=Fimicolochytrium jonesii TaxID=1396493 RepID=UPI0022FDFFF0|nr:uncharacterized protein EV422DRAFT_387167 [Fimicolochytrium jonesii]KAI8822978.1 hypothetical protein EV422DRAFT_387167 [Fimicolochytrium jonesii]